MQNKSFPKTAVIAVAGYGTRRLPITKSIDKCMIPILNRPIIDYIVSDCVEAGISNIIMVVSSDYSQIKNYFGSNNVFENYLIANNKTDKLRLVKSIEDRINIKYVVQDLSQYGTAVPLYQSIQFLDKNEPFVLLMGDDFIDRFDGKSSTGELIRDWQKNKAEHALIGVEVPTDEVSKYGVLDIDNNDNLIGVVEKPNIDNAPSNKINVSKYIFSPTIFSALDRYMKIPNGKEYYITDVINMLKENGEDVLVANAHGEYLDAGNLDSWIEANNYLYNKQKSSKKSITQ